MSQSNAPTLGSKIDALLTPFVQDEAKLQKRLDELNQESQRIATELQQVHEDLGVVQSAKIEALREAAASDPLLSAVFAASVTSATPKLVTEGDEPEIEVIDEESKNQDSHPLLSHAS